MIRNLHPAPVHPAAAHFAADHHKCKRQVSHPRTLSPRLAALGTALIVAAGGLGDGRLAIGQQPDAGQPTAAQPSVGTAAGEVVVKDPSTLQTTRFAPGTVRAIPPQVEPKETFDGPLALNRFLSENPQIRYTAPKFENEAPFFSPKSRTLQAKASEVFLRREIYCFQFSFKPLRQIMVDIPQPNGKMKRKLIWYIVYRVQYAGGDLRPSADEVAGVKVFKRMEKVRYPSRRFFPSFVLRNEATNKEYLDRIIPIVERKIKLREKITAPLLNSVDITKVAVPYAPNNQDGGVWGVAMWEDVDPNLDFISVEVYGLTNAFEQDGQGPDAAYRRKALQLNFYRPGDAVDPTEDRIRFGVPAYADEQEQAYVLKQYGLDERLDYRWIMR